jgi:hypothetical protein
LIQQAVIGELQHGALRSGLMGACHGRAFDLLNDDGLRPVCFVPASIIAIETSRGERILLSFEVILTLL